MRRKIVIIAAVVGTSAVLAGGAIAVAAGGDSEGGVTGTQAERASRAALVATHGGEATAVERDSEEGATWEVEVRRPDGTVVDVRLDERFQVIVIDGDTETADTGDAGA